jgi:hypothetical protein
MGFNMHDGVEVGEEQVEESRRQEDSSKTVQKMKFTMRNMYVK